MISLAQSLGSSESTTLCESKDTSFRASPSPELPLTSTLTVGPKEEEAYRHHLCYLHPVYETEDVFDLTPSIFSEFLEVRQAAEEGKTFIVLVIGSIVCRKMYFNILGYKIATKAIAELKDESYKLKFVDPAHYDISFDDSREVLADLFCTLKLSISS